MTIGGNGFCHEHIDQDLGSVKKYPIKNPIENIYNHLPKGIYNHQVCFHLQIEQFFHDGILCTVRTNVSRISYDFAICKIPHPICTLSKYH